ncbi:MAG: hypothetical protein ACRD19_03260 [Terriglobia bacterium]
MDRDSQAAACRGLRVYCVTVAAACCALLPAAASCRALPKDHSSRPAVDVQKLIRNAAWNQIASMKNHARAYKYVHQEVTSGSKETTLEVETPAGMVSRLIEVDGHPPSEKRCRRNLDRLDRIASSPRLQRSRLKDQQSETSRREQLFQAIPEAFIFTYAGTDKSTGWVEVNYRPNPAFHPRNRVGGVLTGLAGVMWVDPSSEHLVKIDGRVVNPVTFGWGILAKLYPGGRYQMEQQRLPDGGWKLAKLEVHLHGTMLVIKKLNVNMTEIYKSYQDVGSRLTLPAAVEMLKRVRVKCGE